MIFRVMCLLVLVGSIGTSAYFRHRARGDGTQIPRAAESTVFRALRLAVGIPLFLSPIIYIANPEWMRWAALDLPVVLRWVGAALGLGVVAATQWVFRSLGRNVSETVLTKERQELVTFGPYRWIRHPLYATGIGLFVSLGLIASNWFILLVAVVAATMIRLVVIPVEERELASRFGQRYREYASRTGRLVPRLR